MSGCILLLLAKVKKNGVQDEGTGREVRRSLGGTLGNRRPSPPGVVGEQTRD